MDNDERDERVEMPARIYIPHGPAMLMAVSPELQNNEGAWYVRESTEGDVEDLETTAPPDFKWPKPTLAGYDYALSMAELNGFDNVTHAIITAVQLRDARAADAGPRGDEQLILLPQVTKMLAAEAYHYCADCKSHCRQLILTVEALKELNRAYTAAATPSPTPAESDDGWVTFGRVKVDIENETETFERIQPPVAAATERTRRSNARRAAEECESMITCLLAEDEKESTRRKFTAIINRAFAVTGSPDAVARLRKFFIDDYTLIARHFKDTSKDRDITGDVEDLLSAAAPADNDAE